MPDMKGLIKTINIILFTTLLTFVALFAANKTGFYLIGDYKGALVIAAFLGLVTGAVYTATKD
jgi:hypothetical protein